jgi:hypothetical protein
MQPAFRAISSATRFVATDLVERMLRDDDPQSLRFTTRQKAMMRALSLLLLTTPLLAAGADGEAIASRRDARGGRRLRDSLRIGNERRA